MKLTVAVEGMRLSACHGVGEQERTVGNLFEVTVRLEVEVPPEDADSIDATVSYADIAAVIKAEMARPSRLIETVALRLRRVLDERFAPKGGYVEVAKLTPPIAGAEMQRAAVALAW